MHYRPTECSPWSPPRLTTLSLIGLGLSVAITAGTFALDLTVAAAPPGGGRSIGDGLVCLGAVAQPMSSTSHGAGLVLESGVLAGGLDRGHLFSDGLESGSVSSWSAWQGGN